MHMYTISVMYSELPKEQIKKEKRRQRMQIVISAKV